MTRRPVRALLVTAGVGAALLASGIAAAKKRSAPPDGLVVEPNGDRLLATLAGGCPAAPMSIRTKRSRITLQARWKRCGDARKVALSAAFDDACATVCAGWSDSGATATPAHRATSCSDATGKREGWRRASTSTRAVF